MSENEDAPEVSWLRIAGAALSAYAAMPTRQAQAAHARGDSLFQCELPIDGDTARTLSKIEATGWRLESVDYDTKHVETTKNLAEGVETTTNSTRIGHYLFRRVE